MAVAVGVRVAVLVGATACESPACALGVAVAVGVGVRVGVRLGSSPRSPVSGRAGPACSSSCTRVDSAPTCAVRVVSCIKSRANAKSAATTAAIVRSRKTKRKNRFMGDFLYAVPRCG